MKENTIKILTHIPMMNQTQCRHFAHQSQVIINQLFG